MSDVAGWVTHDFRVKTLEGPASGGGGARLGFTCRHCGRKFIQTPANRRTWAVSEKGLVLQDAVTDRWLAEVCLRRPSPADDTDRKLLRSVAA